MVHRTSEAAKAPHGHQGTQKRFGSPTDWQRQIISTYRKSYSLRDAAAKLGVTMQRVHEVVCRHAPELMRPPHVNSRGIVKPRQ